jgi:hypothetical protein
MIGLCTDVLLFKTCGTCGGAGERFVYTDRDWCGDCGGAGEVAIDMSPAVTFFFNVSVAAGLFVAFRAGDNFGFHMGSDESQCTCQWSPTRGVPFQPSTRCEQEDDEPEPALFASMEDLDDVCF